MNKEIHISFRAPLDMIKFQEQIMAEIQKKTSRKVTYSKFFRGVLDILRRDAKLRAKMVSEIARIIDMQ